MTSSETGDKYNSERSEQYVSSTKHNTVIQYIDHYTVLHYLGDIKNKDILDLGCGDGIYCRLLKTKGARKVVGIDISPDMIKLATSEEIRNPLGCEYQIVNAETESEAAGQFDAIISAFVLVYADTAERLSKFCNYIYKNLKPGGVSIILIRNCLSTEFWGDSMVKYGYKFTKLDTTDDGGFACLTWFLSDKGEEFKVKNFVLNSKTYEKCFLNAGFKTFQFKPVLIDENCPIPDNYWDEFLDNPHQIAIIVTK